MHEAYIEIDGKKSTDFGIHLYNELSFQFGGWDAEEVEVPGRDGALFLNKKRLLPVHKSIKFDVTVPGSAHGGDGSVLHERAIAIAQWLPIGRWADFRYSMYPGYVWRALVLDPYEIEDTVRKMGRGVVEFIFHPVMYKDGQEKIAITSGTVLKNVGGREAKPLIYIEATGDVVVQNNGKPWLSLKGVSDHITIDSEQMHVWDDLGSAFGKMSAEIEPAFPVLSMGENQLTFGESVKKLEILPRWGWIAT
uniref:hypothetical protein n=1 Tax=Ndongobacter massiliensis TaxID=1871025 RepID=UPI00092FF523|nr:hypothetical protein [Ndongobacter massiliensis]